MSGVCPGSSTSRSAVLQCPRGVVLRDQRTCFGAKVFARKSSIPFITELAQTMGYDTAHQIAELAKSIGPTVPAAA
jgi:hypothetical protein